MPDLNLSDGLSSSSEDDEVACPSMTQSSTSSSDTVTDNETPPESPKLEGAVFTIGNSDDSDSPLFSPTAYASEATLDMDVATPRPKFTQRSSYHFQSTTAVSGEDTGYESEGEERSKKRIVFGGHRRRRSLKLRPEIRTEQDSSDEAMEENVRKLKALQMSPASAGMKKPDSFNLSKARLALEKKIRVGLGLSAPAENCGWQKVCVQENII